MPLAPDERAGVIEELSSHLSAVESGQSSLRPLGHVFRDPATEKIVVGHCRYALGLVARRRRSEHELLEKIRSRTDDPGIVDEVMVRLIRGQVIDDAAFAAEWIDQRRRLKKLGTAALRSELETKGVDDRTIDVALAEAEDDGEKERCRQLVRERLDKELRSLSAGGRGNGGAPAVDRAALTRRLGSMLGRRGYSTRLALFVINRELDAAGIAWR